MFINIHIHPFLSRERRQTDCLWIGVVPVKQTFSVNSTIFIDELESKFGIFLLKFLIYKPFTYDRTGRILFYPHLVVEEVSNYKFLLGLLDSQMGIKKDPSRITKVEIQRYLLVCKNLQQNP